MKNKILIMAVTLGCMILTTGCTGEEESSSSPAESSTETTSDSAESTSREVTVTTSGVITTVKSTATTVVSTSAESETETTTVTTQPPVSSEDTKKLYKDYFLNHYDTSSDLVCLKDVTHDGIDDMIVICHDAEDIVYSGVIYTIIDSTITKIYEKQGILQHVGNFFNWYLVENNGNWDLAEEYFKMWQGTGETGFREYYLTNSGEEIEQNLIYVESPNDDEFSAYCRQLDKAIENSYRIFYCFSESSATPKQIETNPKVIFELSERTSNTETSTAFSTTTVQTTTKTTTVSTTTTQPPPPEPPAGTSITIISNNKVEINGIVYHYEPKDAKLCVLSDCSIMSLPFENSDILGYTSMYVGGFMSDMLIEHEWYHVIYDGQDAFVRYKDTVDYYETIAGDLYFNNGLAVVSSYTYDVVDYDYSDTLSSDEMYLRVMNADSKNDVLNIIHQKFSAKYDDYNRGETSGDPRENDACAVSSCIDRMYKENNGKVYGYAGDCPYSLDYAYAEYERKDGNEVWFTMTAERAGKEFVSEFSMLWEDGTWKIGAATYPRY